MRLLLLAGTPEAGQIGHAIARDSRVTAIASIAQGSRIPHGVNLPMRIGGWGGDAAFREWLRHEGFDGILDATHPFAVPISERAAAAASDLGLDYVQFLRPAWTPSDGDNWIFLNDAGEAAGHIPKVSSVLLTTGRRRLDDFAGLNGRTVWVRVRNRASGAFPFENGGFLHRPVPLPVANEVAGLKALGVEWMVARNTGGGTGAPLIEAARRMGLPVGMIRRPPQPEVPRIQTVAEALAWVRRRL